MDSLALLGANGIFGVGLFLKDCGSLCAANTTTMYYDCAGPNAFAETALELASQVSNPAALLAQDNNGAILTLPTVPDTGAPAASGSLIFGIGTQTNNVLTASVTTVPADGATAGNFTAHYNGTTLTDGFFDSGSSGVFFNDTAITACPSGELAGGYHCPGAASSVFEVPFTVTITSSQGVSFTVGTVIGNAEFLFSQSGSAGLQAFNDLARPAGASLSNAFDFGVPFFFGKSVFTAFEQRSTPNGSGPYFAYQKSQ